MTGNSNTETQHTNYVNKIEIISFIGDDMYTKFKIASSLK
jgi:hypothetical protein